MSTSFLTKCKILSELSVESSWNTDLNDFAKYHDVGLPMAFMIDQDLIELKDGAESYIEETWVDLCKVLQVDPEAEYESADDMVDKSPLPEIEEE